jgi:hypothetical protein
MDFLLLMALLNVLVYHFVLHGGGTVVVAAWILLCGNNATFSWLNFTSITTRFNNIALIRTGLHLSDAVFS